MEHEQVNVVTCPGRPAGQEIDHPVAADPDIHDRQAIEHTKQAGEAVVATVALASARDHYQPPAGTHPVNAHAAIGTETGPDILPAPHSGGRPTVAAVEAFGPRVAGQDPQQRLGVATLHQGPAALADQRRSDTSIPPRGLGLDRIQAARVAHIGVPGRPDRGEPDERFSSTATVVIGLPGPSAAKL